MALQAVGSFSTCSGCWTGMISIGLLGHIRLMVAVGADIGVASIHTSGIICVGSGVSEALCNCKEHFDSMLALFLA